MSLPFALLVTKTGHFFLLRSYGDGNLKRDKLTFKQFIAEVRKDELLPIFREEA